MKTLYEALASSMAVKGHSLSDADFASSLDGKFQCTMKEFPFLGWHPNTAPGESPMTAADLVVVMKDGGSYRRTMGHDGEQWTYVAPVPVRNLHAAPLKAVHGHPWATCADLNDGEETTPYPDYVRDCKREAVRTCTTVAGVMRWVAAVVEQQGVTHSDVLLDPDNYVLR